MFMNKEVRTIPIRKPGTENIYRASRRKLFTDPGLIVTKSATIRCHDYCDGADFSGCTFRMKAFVHNNGGNNLCDNPAYNTRDTVHNFRDVPRSYDSTHGCPGIHDYHSAPHQPRRRCPATGGLWP